MSNSEERPLAAPRPCAECPWRRDAPLGKWPVERYTALAASVGGPGAEPLPGEPLFACHMTREGRETACAGWLVRHGIDHMSIRLALALGQITVKQLEPVPGWPDLYQDYGELLDAQGGDYARVPRSHPPRRYQWDGAYKIVEVKDPLPACTTQPGNDDGDL